MTPVTFTAYKSEGLRGLPPRVLEQYGIGQTAEGIAFDYRDRSGKVIARKWRDDQKNIRWQGKAKEVVGFGWHLANPERQDAIAITEGEFDAPSIRRHQLKGGWRVGAERRAVSSQLGQETP